MNDKIKKAMDEKRITQAELAEAAGISQAFMSYILNGYKMPSVPVLKRIADKLGVTMDDLIE